MDRSVWTATSRELADAVLARPDDELVPAVSARSSALVSRVLKHDWDRLTARVIGPDGSLPTAFAWRCGLALHHLGHLVEAQGVYASARGDGGAADEAQLAAASAGTAWVQGDRDACATAVERAVRLSEESGDVSARASAWVVRALLAATDGDRDENLRAYQRALELADQAGDRITQVRVLNNLGSRALEEGRYGEAVDRLTEGLKLNDETGHLAGLALLRHNLADALLGLGRADEALVESEAARTVWEAIESPMASAAWQMLADIHAARGNAAVAAAAYADAVRIARAENDAQTLAPALAGLAVTSAVDDPERAAAAVRDLAEAGATMGDVPAVLATGWVALSVGDTATAVDSARRARAEAGRRRDLPSLADALELEALSDPVDGTDARLREASQIWRGLGNPVRQLVNDLVRARRGQDALAERLAVDGLRAYGIHDDAWRIAGPLLAGGTAHRRHVTVHTLGSFGVERDGVPVVASEWPSRKARDIVKILAVQGERGVSRETLGELLWPENRESPGNRLSVALSHLRGVLDPGKEHGSDHFVVADRRSVRLDLRHVEVDVVAFMAASQTALAAARRGDPDAVRLLQAAAAMHTGELFGTDPGDDWLLEARDEVEARGREVLRALSDELLAGERPADAVPWLARLLAYDPYDEPTYVALLRLLSGLGRHGEARRHYRTYVLRMRELEVPAQAWAELVGVSV